MSDTEVTITMQHEAVREAFYIIIKPYVDEEELEDAVDEIVGTFDVIFDGYREKIKEEIAYMEDNSEGVDILLDMMNLLKKL